jgi:ATP-dependent Clp protease adapter protein ClpS
MPTLEYVSLLEKLYQQSPDLEYKLVLHNDDNVEFTSVVSAITVILQYLRPKAVNLAKQAHVTGTSVLKTSTNSAELERNKGRFAALGITTTVER